MVVFAGNQNSPQHYILFVTSGLILWFFFSNVTGQAVGSIVGSTGLLKSINIPPLFFPLSETIGELFNLFLTLIVFLVLMNWCGIVYQFYMVLIIPCIFLFALFSLGLNLLLSSVNVFFRDVSIIWNTIQPALFFLTPIGYPESSISKYRFIIKANPIYYFIKLGRSIFYEPAAPPLSLWLYCTAISVGMYIVGYFVFSRLKNQFISAI